MATFRDLGTDALLDLGVLAPGEAGDADDLNNALRAMNRLVDQWAAERLNIYTVTATEWTIATSTPTYSVGAGGVINVPRPTFVDHVNFKYTPPGATLPVEFPLTKFTDDEWAGLAIKTLPSTLPRSVYYNPTFPLGTLHIWPIPVSPPATLTGIFYAPQQIGEFSDLSTVIALPPGYRRMIVKSLAVEMAASYQRNVDPTLIQAASEAKSAVQASNVRMMDLQFPGIVMGSAAPASYYIRSGS